MGGEEGVMTFEVVLTTTKNDDGPFKEWNWGRGETDGKSDGIVMGSMISVLLSLKNTTKFYRFQTREGHSMKWGNLKKWGDQKKVSSFLERFFLANNDE